MRNLPRLFERAALSPVMILPTTHHSIMQAIMGQMFGTSFSMPQPHAAGVNRFEQPAASQSLDQPQVIGRTAIIPLSGIFMKHASMMDVDCAGACSLETVTENLHAADLDPAIDRIVLWIDSPGGEVVGTPELAAVVRGISEGDRTAMVAFTDSLMCSAGYYVGSQAEQLLATPSAMVGSINTYIYLIDYSEYFEKEGLKAELFTEGKFKGLGLPGLALSDEQRAHLQERVRVHAAEFHAAVQYGRDGLVPAEALEGQTFSGQPAVDAHLVDALVPDIDAALAYAVH